MNKSKLKLIAGTLILGVSSANAQVNASDSVLNNTGGKGISVGGYGVVAYSRMVYSDNVYRYSQPGKYKDDPSHGQFDIPHAVIYLGYDFGHGWKMGT